MSTKRAALLCWKCGASLQNIGLPLSRRDLCPVCAAELHACRLCRHFDVHITAQCRHDYAEPPRDKDRANFCDYFKPSAQAYRPPRTRQHTEVRRQLQDLFSDTPGDSKIQTEDRPLSEEEAARVELKRLFGE